MSGQWLLLCQTECVGSRTGGTYKKQYFNSFQASFKPNSACALGYRKGCPCHCYRLVTVDPKKTDSFDMNPKKEFIC